MSVNAYGNRVGSAYGGARGAILYGKLDFGRASYPPYDSISYYEAFALWIFRFPAYQADVHSSIERVTPTATL